MRVTGSAPEKLHAEQHPQRSGYVLVYLRDNISTTTVTTEDGSTEMFIYDEFTLPVPAASYSEADILANWAAWIETGRALEVDTNASAYQDMAELAASADETIAAMIEDIYNMDMEEIENV